MYTLFFNVIYSYSLYIYIYCLSFIYLRILFVLTLGLQHASERDAHARLVRNAHRQVSPPCQKSQGQDPALTVVCPP